MQFSIRALAVFVLAGNGLLVNGVSLRASNAKQPSLGNIAMPGSIVLATKLHDDVDYEVVNKTSIKRDNSSVDCLCKIGSFWHWRIKSCVKQGGWGYECGFFPEEHHNKVCQDGLKCEPLKQTRVVYEHPGAKPASCQTCEAEDKCLAGEERHNKNCLKEYKLSGEACQTVKVKMMATAHVKVTEEVKKTASATATATATAEEKATATNGGKSATATKKATAEGKASAEAEGKGTATASAKATEEGVAEGKGCISLDAVKKLLDLQDVKSIGAVLSSQVVSRGDEEAFDLAYAKALEAAQKAGLINAKQAANALASAEAREHAALEAKAKADEAAAWKAEAGASKDAQGNAAAKALARATTAAGKAAADAAGVAYQADADAAKAEAAAEAAEKAAAGGGGAGGGAMSKEEAAAAKADAAEARAKAKEARAAAAAAQARADAADKAAAEAQAAKDAIGDLMNPAPTQAPARPTKASPTSPPRKISPEQIAAKLP